MRSTNTSPLSVYFSSKVYLNTFTILDRKCEDFFSGRESKWRCWEPTARPLTIQRIGHTAQLHWKLAATSHWRCKFLLTYFRDSSDKFLAPNVGWCLIFSLPYFPSQLKTWKWSWKVSFWSIDVNWIEVGDVEEDIFYLCKMLVMWYVVFLNFSIFKPIYFRN